MTRVNLPGQFNVRRSAVSIERLEPREMFAGQQTQYVFTYLTSNVATATPIVDSNLINGWGLALSPAGTFVVADNGTGVTTAYDAGGNQSPSSTAPLVVTIPPGAASTTGISAPTGVVLNTSKSFAISSGGKSGVASYLFVTEDGTIAGYNPAVNSAAAVTVVDASASGAVYKGLAVVGTGKKAQILAANFHTGQIDVYNAQYQLVSSNTAFHDLQVPVGYAPFNVETVAGKIYVTYAMQDANKHDDVAGAGHGFVDVYSTKGILLQRFAPQATSLGGTGPFNSPWAVVKAPAGFGSLGGDILVGNFGDGSIDAFNNQGALVAVMQGTNGAVMAQGLWGLAFGKGSHRNTLYFASGPGNEADGAIGTIALPAKVHKHG